MGIFSSNWNPKGKHCYVTGGSSGLGLEVAKRLTKQGAHVSIVARNEKTLANALAELEALRVSPDQKLANYSFSLYTPEGSAAALDAACAPFDGRVPDAAFFVAGASTPKFFVEMTEEDLRKGMDDGYWIQAWSAHEIVKRTVRQDFKGGKILFVGSTLSLMGFVSFASYSPAKHALRGLADTLRHELLLYQTDVHIYFAGTMNTPGYEHEIQTKPKIAVEIEGDEGYSVESNAKALLAGVASGQNHICYDLNTHFFRVSTRGSAPHHNNFIWEIILMIIAWIGVPIWRWGIDKQIIAHRAEHQEYLKNKGLIQSS